MMTFPDDCIQELIEGDWWEKDPTNSIGRGALVKCHVPFFSKIPQQLVAERNASNQHTHARMKTVPLSARGRAAAKDTLPVAGLGTLEGADAFIVQRCKHRPCLVLGGANPTLVSQKDAAGMANSQTAPYFLVSPYYSVGQANHSGYNSPLLTKVRHAHFRQFFWDQLPIPGGKESILRFDQTFPVGHEHASFSPTGYRLSEAALFVLDQWLNWYLNGSLPDEDLNAFKELIAEFYS